MTIKLDQRNANTHDEASRAGIGSSLDAFGVGRSVVADNSLTLIAGNGVYEEAERRGIKRRFVHTNGDELVVVVRDDLSPDDPRRTGLALADNRVQELSVWDADVASQLFASLPADLQGATAFDQAMIDQLLADQQAADDAAAADADESDDAADGDDDAEPITSPPTFQLIIACEDAQQQQMLFEEMSTRGIVSKMLTV